MSESESASGSERSATPPISGAVDAKGRWNTTYHAPVMIHEVLDALGAARRVLDCTLGGGGHSAALLESGASVVGIDRDPAAIAVARTRLAEFEAAGRFCAVQGNYADIATITACGADPFDGILLDLGISSHQVNDTSRGFTFREGAPLDMRMGTDVALDAAGLLNTAPPMELARIFREYADEPHAPRLGREIERRRGNAPFATSDDLVNAIRASLGPRSGPGDFARLFQAIRIAVNDEIGSLERALPALRERLAVGGRLAVIAYHSGEDRVVKHLFRDWSVACTCPPMQPRCICGGVAPGRLLRRKAIVPSEEEQARNPRSRSARLRVWERSV